MTQIATFVNFCGLVVSETRLGTTRDKMLDPLGSVIGEYNDSQTVTGRTEYWPYGEIASETGTLLPSPLKFVGGLGYFRDRIATFLTYIRARWYYPWSTRWTTVDPLWPGESAYGYVGSRPLSAVDPSGKIGLYEIENCLSFGCRATVDPCMKASSAFGRSGKNDLTNALGHCMTACCIQRRFPQCRWYWDGRELSGAFGQSSSRMDDWNNRVGYCCAGETASCFECCLANKRRLTWIVPRPHNWPPTGFNCWRSYPPVEKISPCGGKKCPQGSTLDPVSCECRWA